MTGNSRQMRIQDLLSQHGERTVEQLAGECGVSTMTIRRDLQVMEEQGKILRSHGGAAPLEQVMFQFEFKNRGRIHMESKRLIAGLAAGLIGEGQSIMLDSGTTTLALAMQLKHRKRLTLITTSLAIASALQFSNGVQVLLLGGFVRRDSPDLAGIVTEMNLENLRADLAFIGADGIDLEGNIYNASIEVCHTLSKMAAAARDAYIVSDSSKIGKTALMRFGNISCCKGLITDAGITPEQLAELQKAGVHVIITQPEVNSSDSSSATAKNIHEN
jgi:DeoR/GlpR family transcriptional regulator of sugar metabolism